MNGPKGIPIHTLSKDVGVSPPTLYRWIEQSGLGGMSKDSTRRKQGTWNAAGNLRVVKEAAQLTDEELGIFIRREGLYSTQISE